MKMAENNKKISYQDELNQHPEIIEALEAMQRTSAFEVKEVKDLFELEPSYFPIKSFR
jgi:hypothetical protein